MSKTMTIPKRFGYPTMEITINGKVYTVETGREVTIEDALAEVIENALALEPKPGEVVDYKKMFDSLLDGSITYAVSDAETVIAATFRGCSNLATVDLKAVKNISAQTFASCTNLETLILRPEGKCSLANVNAFTGVSNNVYVYVPKKLIGEYTSDPNWSSIAFIFFRAIEDYPSITQ